MAEIRVVFKIEGGLKKNGALSPGSFQNSRGVNEKWRFVATNGAFWLAQWRFVTQKHWEPWIATKTNKNGCHYLQFVVDNFLSFSTREIIFEIYNR